MRPYSTGWTLLGPNRKITLQLTETARKDQDWQLLQRNLGAVTTVVGLFTPVSVPAGAAGAVDTIVNLALGTPAPGTRAASAPIVLDPEGGGAYAYTVEYRDITSPAKTVFGTSTIRVEFKKSMGASRIWQEGVKLTDPTPAVDISAPISSMTLVSPPTPTSSLAAQPDWVAIQNAANVLPTDKKSFTGSCEAFKAAAKAKAGMTRLDANLSLLDALASTNWRQRPELVRSECFTADDHTALQQSGHPVPEPIIVDAIGAPLLISADEVPVLGSFLRRARKPDLKFDQAAFDQLVSTKVQAPLTVYPQVDGVDITYETLPVVDALVDLQKVGVDRFCCVATVMRTDPNTGVTAPTAARRRLGLLLPPQPGLRAKYVVVDAELSTTPDSGSKLGTISLLPVNDARSAEVRGRICSNTDEPAPDYLACQAH